MPDEPAYIRNLKAFTRSDLTFMDLPSLEAEIYGGSDRARAVMLAAIAESALEVFVRANLRPTFSSDDNRLLFDFNAPLGNFSAKILVPYAFNMFGPDTRHDLDLIRILRNAFAHCRKSFGFETAQIAAVCKHFRAPDSPDSFIPHGYLEAVPHEELRNASDKNHPRTRYIATCHIVAERLLSNAGGTKPLDLP